MSWTTAQAAKAAGMTPAAFRRVVTRARAAGVELQTHPSTWPDARSRLYDPERVCQWLASRPGQGVGGGRPKRQPRQLPLR